MTNNCNTARNFDIPLSIDGKGQKNVTVSGLANAAANQVACQAISISRDTTSFILSGVSSLPAFGSTQDIALSVYIPQGNMLYVTCSVNPGGRINKVEWSL